MVYNRPALSGVCNVFQALDDLLGGSVTEGGFIFDVNAPQFELGEDKRLLSLLRDFDLFDGKRDELRRRLQTEQSASLTNPAEIERLERELFNLVPPGFRFDLPHGKDCILQFNIAIEDMRTVSTQAGKESSRPAAAGEEGRAFFGLVGWNAARSRFEKAQGFNATARGLLRKIREWPGFIVTDTNAFCMTATLPQGAEIEFFYEFFSAATRSERVSLFMTLSGTVRCCCFGAPSPEEEQPPAPTPTPIGEPAPTERPVTQDVVPSPPVQTITEIPSIPVQCRVAALSDASLPSTIKSVLSFLTLASGKLSFDSAGGILNLSETSFVKTPSLDEANRILRFQFLLTNLQGPETRIDAAGRKTATPGTANVSLNLAALDSGGKNIAFAQRTIPTRLPILSSGAFSFIPESTMSGVVKVKSDGMTIDFEVNLPINARVVTITFTEDSSFTAKEFSAGVCELPGTQTP
ncbi:MAG: hypothetical protein AAB309_00365 [Deltaproteobacteria bacterium]